MSLRVLAALLIATTAHAQQPVPQPPALPPAQDVAWPGTIALAVDATDVARHILSVTESIPVSGPGPLTLLYPRFVPGTHGPTGPLGSLAGLVITADGAPVRWTRDPVAVEAFHLTVPEGAAALDVKFQYLAAATSAEGRVEMTPDMIDLSWNTVVLYPAGFFARGITIQPTVTLPEGWHAATALEPGTGPTAFAATSLETLVDSPLYAGRYTSRIDLAPGAPVPVFLDLVADRPEDLVVSPDQLEKHRALVRQATRAFGSHHYAHYDFLLALSDALGGKGLEHQQSSENAVGRNYFSDWDAAAASRELLPHEYTHSWNGKFRRPADLWAPDFSVPERDSLLWVYEGQTQFWGQILAARSGLWSKEQALDALALDAASEEAVRGRAWRALQDTTNDPLFVQRRPMSFPSWSRAEDYYTEGLLIWLDADTLIRERTDGAKSLDDFARGFFGVDDGSATTRTYVFDDVVAALNAVLPYDWAGFLRTRLDAVGGGAPLDGLARGGYRLVYDDKRSAFLKSAEARGKSRGFAWSIGVRVGEGGVFASVGWDTPAFRAGALKGGKILAVDGLAYEGPEDLEAAIKRAHADTAPIEVLVRDGNQFRTLRIDYHDGPRYPHLERIEGTPARIDDLLRPRD